MGVSEVGGLAVGRTHWKRSSGGSSGGLVRGWRRRVCVGGWVGGRGRPWSTISHPGPGRGLNMCSSGKKLSNRLRSG